MLLNNELLNNGVNKKSEDTLKQRECEHNPPNLQDAVKTVLRGKLIAIGLTPETSKTSNK